MLLICVQPTLRIFCLIGMPNEVRDRKLSGEGKSCSFLTALTSYLHALGLNLPSSLFVYPDYLSETVLTFSRILVIVNDNR